MSATTIVTVDYIFQDNTTYLNQENWQGFFGSSLQDGFTKHSGIEQQGQYILPAFTAYFNGLQVTSSAIVPLIPVAQAEVDSLLCLVYESGQVHLNKYTNLSTNASDAVTRLSYILNNYAKSLSELRSYLRYELSLSHDILLPVIYEIYGYGYYDLSRVLHLNNEEVYAEDDATSYETEVATPACGILFQSGLAQIYGGHRYDIILTSGYPLSEYHLYPVPAVSMDPATIYIENKKSSAVTIKLPLSYRQMYFDYMTDGSWTEDSGYMTYSLAGGSTLAITSKQVRQKYYQSGGVNYPKSVYTISQFVKSA